MHNQKELTIRSSPDEVIVFFRNSFLNNSGQFCDQRGIDADVAEGLQKLLESQLVADFLTKQWTHETGTKWGDRPVNEALFETAGHAFSALIGEAYLFVHRNNSDKFPGMDRDEVEAIGTGAGLLFDYFAQTLPQS